MLLGGSRWGSYGAPTHSLAHSLTASFSLQDARSDQCDQRCSLMKPTDLVTPHSLLANNSTIHSPPPPRTPQDARGDQCDKCGALMNPTDLINPRCKLTGTVPVIRSTRHLFLDLPKLSDR
jgi:methionyl-tRNA synthetase